VYYLIDGYNLIHQVGLVHPKDRGLLDWARRQVVQKLEQHFGADAANVTVVFDAHRAARRQAQPSPPAGVQVVFTHDRLADDLIEELIRKASAPRLLTVVSDDARLVQAARRRGCPVAGCVAFYESLTAPPPGPGRPTEAPEKPEQEGDPEEWLRAFGDLD
jgi:uncharacterized protein